MSWAHYILQVNIYLVVFYGFYKLLLDKETYFTLNRVYLLSAGLFSLLIPFLRFEWFSTQPVVQPLYVGVGQLNDFVTQATIVQDIPNDFSTGNLIVLIYLTGIIFFTGKFIWQLFSVRKFLRRPGTGAAFSFFNQKRIDGNLPQLQTIHTHEEIHINQLHSIDILFFEMIGIFTWFNPIIYLYKNALKNIHEYLADEAAAKFQGDKEQYALLLLSNAFGVPASTLTNSFFNKSLIKRRIFMLHQPKSKKTAILKYGLFLPLFAIALTLSSATIRNNDKIQEIADHIPLNTPLTVINEVVDQSIKKTAVQTPDIRIAQAGQEWEDFYTYVKRSIRYPLAARQARLQGTTMIKFTVSDGQVENAGIATKLGEGCDAEVMKVIVSYPGYKDIKNGKYTLRLTYLLDDAKTPVKNKNIASLKGYTALSVITVTAYEATSNIFTGHADPENRIYDFIHIDKQPGFPGGMENLYKYLTDNIKYPAEARKNNVQGKVFLSFIVEKNGDIADIKVERRLGSGTDEEAVRLLKESPKWIPGIHDGKPVRVKYNIPINFNLNGPQSDHNTPQKSGGESIGHLEEAMLKDVNGPTMKFNSIPSNVTLFILDGKKSDRAEVSKLKPEEIEAIHVLKDQQAIAIYGTQAKEGAALVTTKTGRGPGKSSETKKTTEEK